jgi:hypothetical protein
VIGLKEITPGLNLGERVVNRGLAAGKKIGIPFRSNDAYGTAAMRERKEALKRARHQGNQLAMRDAVALRQAFPDMDPEGYIPSLAGINPRAPGAPSWQDVLANKAYEPHLTPEQWNALQRYSTDHGMYTELLHSRGVGWKSRPDVQIGGGEYAPRVRTFDIERAEQTPAPMRGMIPKVKKGFEEEAKYETMAHGRADGVQYATVEDTLRYHFVDAGERAVEAHLAKYLTEVTDAADWPIWKPKVGEQTALRQAVDLPGLAEYDFPAAVADSINKVLASEGGTIGRGSNMLKVVRNLNDGYRSMRANADLAWGGIQGLLTSYTDYKAAATGYRIAFQAWADPRVLARHLDWFTATKTAQGRLGAGEWVTRGVVQGAVANEFNSKGLEIIPLFKRFQRAFMFQSDAHRLEIADTLLEMEMKGYSLFGQIQIGKGRTLEEIAMSGDLERIASIANNMTGTAKSRFGGDIGEIVLFAPRFLQSRLETVVKGAMGLAPGASLEQRIARRSLFKMVGIGTALTFAINGLNGEETDTRPLVNGKWNPNFMRVRAMGRDWSLFGTWDSLARMMVSVGNRDVQGAIRAQGSGLTTVAWDMISGEDFLGRPTGNSAELYASYALRTITPFSGEELTSAVGQAAEGDVGGAAVGAAGTFFGAKSSEVSFSDRADIIARTKYHTSWSELTGKYYALRQQLVDSGKTTSRELDQMDKVMDSIRAEVDKQERAAEGKRNFPLTLSARRESIAREKYGRGYKDLYPNQQIAVNKAIAQTFGGQTVQGSQRLPWR